MPQLTSAGSASSGSRISTHSAAWSPSASGPVGSISSVQPPGMSTLPCGVAGFSAADSPTKESVVSRPISMSSSVAPPACSTLR
ncbi:hypothetical protein [Streptomyces sp. B6B3]|uniref:hypothetical protein n=1 Tax=Streptomyces sp. B6B3 TaxID=3153570 RepID=UPI00325E4D5E